MSDEDEYEYEYGSDEDYDYGSQEEQDDGAIEIENAFYEADDCSADDPKHALEIYEKCVRLETERGDEVKWRFKALQHVCTLHFRLGSHQPMTQRYQEMLGYMSSVTRNECTDAINSVLDSISSSKDLQILSKMYEITLEALKSANNERLWFNTNVKLGKLYLGLGDHNKLQRTIKELHKSCQSEDGKDDLSKGTYLLEVYALEVQHCTATKNSARMKELYPRTLKLDAAIADPRIMGVIREEGGKLYMSEERWKEAYDEFFEGFRNYQEAGNSRARDCLKYVVLANMLALSDINPFDSREAKVYQDDTEIKAMVVRLNKRIHIVDLRASYENNDIVRFERLLRDKRNRILDDAFIMTYVEPLLRNIRAQVLMELVKPYQRIKIDFISREINITAPEVESLLVELILDHRIVGKIDQTQGFLVLKDTKNSASAMKYEAIGKWTETLTNLTKAVHSRTI